MQVCFFLLLIQLHITEGCRLEGNESISEITADTGGSVLLSCSCTDLHIKPPTFTWYKYTNDWVAISPESHQYKYRFQLINDYASGNFSVLISHLTEEDGADYRCSVKGGYSRDFRLTVKGCTLNTQSKNVIGYVGQSVLLSCFCSELEATPQTFRWTVYKESDHKEIFPKDQRNHYTYRVQGFKDQHPGNLSLLISNLTVDDGGHYTCEIKGGYGDIHLKVKDAPTSPSSSSSPIKITSERESLPFIPFAVVTAVLLHIIVAVVYCTTRKKGSGTVHYRRGDADGTVSLQ